MNKYQFIALRFFIVPVDDSLFYKPADNTKKKKWFKEALLTTKDFVSNRGNNFAIRISEQKGGLGFGKLSREKTTEKHEKTPSDIKDIKMLDWPYLNFVCDLSEQLLVIEYKTTFGISVKSLTSILSEHINNVLLAKGYSATFDPIVEEGFFWEIIDAYTGVFSLTFNLTSPNLFGASSAANESLKALQKVFNNNRTSVVLSNDDANLKLPEEELDSYRDYADKGGGDWEIAVKTKKGRKKTFKSTDKTAKVMVESDRIDTEVLREALNDFIRRLS